MNKPIHIIIQDQYTGNMRQINLGHARRIDISSQDFFGPGLDLIGIWIQPRAHRVIIHIYSRWQDHRRPGHVRGASFREADEEEIRRISKYLGEGDKEEILRLIPFKPAEAIQG